MTSNSWFQTWHPSANVIPYQNPFQGTPSINNFTFEHDVTYHEQKSRVNRPDTILPYLLSLSMVKADSRQQYNELDYGDKLPPMERTGPFQTWYQWGVLDFVYPSKIDRDEAIVFEDFIPKNNLPLGLEVYKDRIFVTMPKWKPGVPVTLAVIPRVPKERSPPLVPYPDWSWHKAGG